MQRNIYLKRAEYDMTRRSQMEICIDILKAVTQNRIKPTHIMYRANLSWSRLKKHLNFLVSQDLLVKSLAEGSRVYLITHKGKEVLNYFRKIEET